MKELRVTLPEKRRNIMDEFLAKINHKPEPVLTQREGFVTYSMYVSNDQTNFIIQELKGRGIGDVYGQIALMPVELLLGSFDKEESSLKSSMGVNIEELLFTLTENGVLSGTYVLLCILSGLLAAFGLATKSIVILIGSMIVSPLLSPIVLTSVGLISPGTSYLKKGINAEIIGLLIVILTGFFSGIFLDVITSNLTGPAVKALDLNVCTNNEIYSRTVLDIATIGLAISSGFAAGIIISKGQSVNVVGVAIAASLCPPAANIGVLMAITITTSQEFLSLLALGWLLANIFIINISICIVLWTVGIVRGSGITARKRGTVIRTNIIWIVIFTIFTVLLYWLMNVAQNPCP